MNNAKNYALNKPIRAFPLDKNNLVIIMIITGVQNTRGLWKMRLHKVKLHPRIIIMQNELIYYVTLSYLSIQAFVLSGSLRQTTVAAPFGVSYHDWGWKWQWQGE